jgi:hypothetical protein
VSGLGTGVATALAINVGSAGAPVVNGGALGTPSSGTVTNLTGTASININGTVGATTPTTGAFTTLSASSNVTLSGGTANGVLYLNGSKVATSGSALTFDGSLLSNTGRIKTATGSTGGSFDIGYAANTDSRSYRIQNDFNVYGDFVIAQSTTQTGTTYNALYSALNSGVQYWSVGGSEAMRLTSTGLGIGTSSISSKLVVKVQTNANAEFRTTDAIFGTVVGGVGIDALNDARSSVVPFGIRGSTLSFGTSAGLSATLDSSGNLGLGVTPSAWSVFKAMEFGAGSFASISNAEIDIVQNAAYLAGTNWTYNATAAATMYRQGSGAHSWWNAPSGTAGNAITFTQAMTLDASGRWMLGTTSPFNAIGASIQSQSGTWAAGIHLRGPSVSNGCYFAASTSSTTTDFEIWNEQNGYLRFATNNTERARITSGGDFVVGKTDTSLTSAGASIEASGVVGMSTLATNVLYINRQNDDGSLVDFRQANTSEGNISVSGTTVSYNGGHLSRWSQLPDGSKDDNILKGTVMTNLDAMCEWVKDGQPLPNEQLNRMKVSDVEGDTNVAGVFVNWTRDEDCNTDDMNVAMTGDMIIRIAQGVVVHKGDLLMSAGDGTAKPQGDDIRRSKTVAKVTSTHVTCTYADGSYCVPCVLMAC